MTIVGIDDTDSRTAGMCTTYVAHRVAERLREVGRVRRTLLVRLNPAVAFKTRGNAALAIHAAVDPDVALECARAVVEDAARQGDPDTHPGLVVAPDAPTAVPGEVGDFARRALRDLLSLEAARDRLAAADYRYESWGNGRGLVGALAAVGAWQGRGPNADWTHEHIAYRQADRRGTPRDVDAESVFIAADRGYPTVWDTVDRATGDVVCVPHTPGPVLYGIRGDDPEAVRSIAEDIDSEPVATTESFVTNQGTDDHLRTATVPATAEGRSYRVDGVVVSSPETREGGHVHLTLAAPEAFSTAGPEDDRRKAVVRDALETDPGALAADHRLPCVAFEPTGRFRRHVRRLRVGDRLTVCGEVGDGHLKLEKFALRATRTVQWVVPDCPDCGRSMESAGADQGYRCRDCGTGTPGRIERPMDRCLDHGWYEVPPSARRHVAKPLVRGGFDAPTHPER